jgi:hypothetical protein
MHRPTWGCVAPKGATHEDMQAATLAGIYAANEGRPRAAGADVNVLRLLVDRPVGEQRTVDLMRAFDRAYGEQLDILAQVQA